MTKCGAKLSFDWASSGLLSVVCGCGFKAVLTAFGERLSPYQGPIGWSLGVVPGCFDPKHEFIDASVSPTLFRHQTTHKKCEGTLAHTRLVPNVLIVLGHFDF